MAQKNIISGLYAVQMALEGGVELETVFIQKGNRNKRLLDIKERAVALNYPVKSVPIFKLDKLVKDKHDGIVALRSLIEYQPLDNVVQSLFEQAKVPALVALDRITDVRNFGAIARSAEAMGVHGLIVPKYERALVNSEAMQISTNALRYLNIIRENNLAKAIEFLKLSGLQVVGLSERASVALHKIDLTMPTVLIIGSEQDGISPSCKELCDVLGCIQTTGKIQALNASVAASIAIYELTCQRI